MTEVPEYLLRRSRERREALGLGTGGGDAPPPAGDAPPPPSEPAPGRGAAPARRPSAPAVGRARARRRPRPPTSRRRARGAASRSWMLPGARHPAVLGVRLRRRPRLRQSGPSASRPSSSAPRSTRRTAPAVTAPTAKASASPASWRARCSMTFPERGRPRQMGAGGVADQAQGHAVRRPGARGRPARRRAAGDARVRRHPVPAKRSTPSSCTSARRSSSAADPIHDVVVVGAGPSGAACAYWLAEAGHDVLLRREEALPAREDLRRRPDAAGGQAARRHGPRRPAAPTTTGSRACARSPSAARSSSSGRSTPGFPRHGYVVTRHDLDDMVAERAVKAGATLLAGPRGRGAARRARPGAGRDRDATRTTGRTDEVRGRYVVVADGANSRFGRALGTQRDRVVPAGHGDPRLLRVAPPRRAVDRVAPRHPRPGGQRAARLRLDLPGRRRPGERRHRPAVDVQPVEGGQHHQADGRLRRLGARSRGTSARDLVRAADRRPAADGALGRPARGPDVARRRRRRRRHQPVQRRGHRLRVRDRPPGRRRAARGARLRRRPRAPGATTAACRRRTASTSRWRGRSCTSSAGPS